MKLNRFTGITNAFFSPQWVPFALDTAYCTHSHNAFPWAVQSLAFRSVEPFLYAHLTEGKCCRWFSFSKCWQKLHISHKEIFSFIPDFSSRIEQKICILYTDYIHVQLRFTALALLVFFVVHTHFQNITFSLFTVPLNYWGVSFNVIVVNNPILNMSFRVLTLVKDKHYYDC